MFIYATLSHVERNTHQCLNWNLNKSQTTNSHSLVSNLLYWLLMWNSHNHITVDYSGRFRIPKNSFISLFIIQNFEVHNQIHIKRWLCHHNEKLMPHFTDGHSHFLQTASPRYMYKIIYLKSFKQKFIAQSLLGALFKCMRARKSCRVCFQDMRCISYMAHVIYIWFKCSKENLWTQISSDQA